MRLMSALVGALMVAGLVASTASVTARTLAPGPGRLSFVFRPARGKAAQAGKRLWSDGFVPRTVTQLNARLTLPRNTKIVLGRGNSGDTIPTGPHPRVLLSYQFAAAFRPYLSHYGVMTWQGRVVKPKGVRGRRLVTSSLQQMQHGIMLHELGHAYTLTWQLPQTADDEQVADLFASWAAVKVLHDPRAVLALANFREAVAASPGAPPGIRAWNRAQGYADLFRLYNSNIHTYRDLLRLVPSGYLGGPGGHNYTGGPWAGIEALLQPIALVALG